MAFMEEQLPLLESRVSGKPSPGRSKVIENILIVDDYEPGLWVLSEILRETVENITLAENGKEALEMVKACGGRFDVILSDVNMPIMDGITFFREAVLYEPSLGSRFLFFTGLLSPQMARFFERNNLNYLEKPAGAEKILQAVAKVRECGLELEHAS